jgi:SAM-dependent methyltransferase
MCQDHADEEFMRYFDKTEKEKKETHLLKHPLCVQQLFKNISTVHDVYDDLLSPYVRSDNVLLDAGCGKKGILDKYKGKLKFAVGCDLSFSAIKQNAAADGRVLANLNGLPFPDGTFDIIISQWALEHIPDPDACFKEFCRVLKPKGGLIIVSNSIHNPLMFFSSIFPEKIRDKIKIRLLPPEIEEDTFPTYYRCNSLKKVEEVIEPIGFKKVYDAYVGDASFFIFSRFLFPFLLLYEKVTDISILRKYKMHIVAHYLKL